MYGGLLELLQCLGTMAVWYLPLSILNCTTALPISCGLVPGVQRMGGGWRGSDRLGESRKEMLREKPLLSAFPPSNLLLQTLLDF